MFTISKKYCCRKIDGNKIFDVSELFRCYFDIFSIFFRGFFSMFSLSMFCLFRVFAFLCFVVLCFVIDPLYQVVSEHISDHMVICECIIVYSIVTVEATMAVAPSWLPPV